MSKLSLLIFFTILSCQTSSVNKINKQTSFFLQLTKGYLSKCLYPQALVEVRNALNTDPESFITNDAAGVVYSSLRKYKKAEQYFLKSIKIAPTYTQAKVNLTQVYIYQKKYDLALTLLKEIEADLTYLNPGLVQFLIGQALVAKKKYTEATKYLTTSRQISPRNCSSFLELGKISFYRKNHNKALQYFTKTEHCLRKNVPKSSCMPKIAEHYYFRGLSSLSLKKYKEAQKQLKLYLFNSKRSDPYYSSSEKLLKRMQKK